MARGYRLGIIILGGSPTPSPILTEVESRRTGGPGDGGTQSYANAIDLTNVSTITMTVEYYTYFGRWSTDDGGKKYYYYEGMHDFGVTATAQSTSFNVSARRTQGWTTSSYGAFGPTGEKITLDVSNLSGLYYISCRCQLINGYNSTYSNGTGSDNAYAKILNVTFS